MDETLRIERISPSRSETLPTYSQF